MGWRTGGVSTRLIAGTLLGARSAVQVSSPLFYAEARTEAGSMLRLPAEHSERALFVVEGAATVGAKALISGDMAVFHAGGEVRCRSDVPSRLLLLGGEPLEGPRHIVWNFVSSSRERIDQAASDWRAQRFDRVPGETSYIPLPEDGGAPVNYP
jgi:redox-sensitive bicupin YhaK (pirin superfamily)